MGEHANVDDGDAFPDRIGQQVDRLEQEMACLTRDTMRHALTLGRASHAMTTGFQDA